MKPVELNIARRKVYSTAPGIAHVRVVGYVNHHDSLELFFAYLCDWAKNVDRERDEADRNTPAP